MKSKLKQSLVLVLTFALLMANVPTSVFAEDNQSGAQEEPIVQQDENDPSPDETLTEGNSNVLSVSNANANNNAEQTQNQSNQPHNCHRYQYSYYRA